MIVSFTEVEPPARYAPLVGGWTAVRIEEALVSTGPWTALPDLAIAPGGTPQDPDPVSFSTDDATLEVGWYRVRFVDATDSTSAPSEPVLNSPNYDLPTVRDVGMRLHMRTITAQQQYLGTFTDDTLPTGEQVEAYLRAAHNEVYGRVGAQTDPVKIRKANETIIIYASMLIELSHFADQIRQGRSPYEELKKLFDANISSLLGLTEDGGPTTPPDETGYKQPSYGFPGTSIGDGVMP